MIKTWAKLVMVMISLAIIFWPGISHHWEIAKDPYFVPFDASQYIPPFFKYDRNEPVPTTYMKEYYLNAVCPLLYKWLFTFGEMFWDIRHFQAWMMYFAYLIFVIILARLAWILGGATLCFAVVAFTFAARIFVGMGFIGGSARMYAYPLIAFFLYSLFLDRPKHLAVTVVLAGFLYPLAAIIGAVCLASWLLLPPMRRKGVASTWSFSQRLGILALTGVLTSAGVLPLLIGGTPYGRRVIETDIDMYPEAGPDGNYRPFDRLPYEVFGNEWISYYIGPLYSHGDPIVPWFNVHRNLDPLSLLLAVTLTAIITLCVIMGATRRLLKEDSSGRGIRLILFFIVCGILHVISWAVSPYLYIPTRYFMFSLPFLITLIFPWSLYMLLKQTSQLVPGNAAFIGIIIVYLMAFGARGNVKYSASALDRAANPLLNAIAILPNDIVVAGWPAGVIQKVEYVARRNVFLTQDIHQVLHFDFMRIMRLRMDALFDAYLSTDATAVNRLRQEFGITHLLIETRHFSDPRYPPEYFSPWRSRIQSRLAEIKGNEYLMSRSLHEKAAIFKTQELILLDLTKLP